MPANQIYPKMENKVIEKNFQRIRQEKGLSWADLSAKAGVNNYQQILGTLRNKSATINKVEELAALLGVHLFDLLQDGNEAPEGPGIICPYCGNFVKLQAHKHEKKPQETQSQDTTIQDYKNTLF